MSVVIANYNYAHFLADAVDSALALDWPDVEVVMADNGSTDGSCAVVARYGDRVVALPTEHGEQPAAAVTGFSRTTGEVVLFLDADDVLPPETARREVEAMGPRTTQVQLQMLRVDASGHRVGGPFPRYRPVPRPLQVRHWLVTTSAYPIPPGSGNANARRDPRRDPAGGTRGR